MEINDGFLKKSDFVGFIGRFQISDINQQVYFTKTKTTWKGWQLILTGTNKGKVGDFKLDWLFLSDLIPCAEMWNPGEKKFDEQKWKGNLVDITAIPQNGDDKLLQWKITPVPKTISV